MGPVCLGLEGGHLWIGGHHTQGGGLWMYDIATGTAMVYRVETTMDGQRKGLPSNWVQKLTADKDQVWLYGTNSLQPCGLTRFRYKAREHAERWTTYTVESTASARGKKDGLAAKEISAVVPADNGEYWVFPNAYVYHRFHPQSGKWTTFRYLPHRPYGVPPAESFAVAQSPRGDTGKICQRVDYQHVQFHALRKGLIWIGAGLQGDTEKWGSRFGFGAVLGYDPAKGTYLLFNDASTESRPSAHDGLLGYPSQWCWDGDEAWIGCSPALNRYNEKTREFTQYVPGRTAGLPAFRVMWSVAATRDSIWVGTDAGLLRFKKTSAAPKLVEAIPAAGAKGVVVRETLTARFDLPLNESTLSTNSVELWGNGALVPGKVFYDRVQRAVIFRLAAPLPAEMNCEFVLKSLIQSETGNPIAWTRIAFTTK
jgi:hypothetical protein